jgi:hypothetical protein
VLDFIIDARARDIGGLTVGRLLPSPRRRMIGPFIFLDHMGPTTHVGDVLPHPHIGLSTVTYLFAGENVHRDSLGTVQAVRAGDLNIMSAGRGIVHSERHDPGAAPTMFHGVQIWVALPEANEDDAPSFSHHAEATLPALDEPGIDGRVLIGSAFGVTSPVEHPSRPLLVDLAFERGGCIDVPAADERGVYVVSGRVRIESDEVAADQLAVMPTGRIEALEAARVIVIGGPAMSKRLIDWNFVASTQDRIDRARAAWQAQTFPKIPGDDREYVPLPLR